MSVVTACPTCRYVHGADDGCWYDDCGCCGGTYPFGPSRSSLCCGCASAPDLDEKEN